jgi:hypothetical protein
LELNAIVGMYAVGHVRARPEVGGPTQVIEKSEITKRRVGRFGMTAVWKESSAKEYHDVSGGCEADFGLGGRFRPELS